MHATCDIGGRQNSFVFNRVCILLVVSQCLRGELEAQEAETPHHSQDRSGDNLSTATTGRDFDAATKMAAPPSVQSNLVEPEFFYHVGFCFRKNEICFLDVFIDFEEFIFFGNKII